MQISSSLLHRSTQEDSTEIYYKIFWTLYKFLIIMEVYTIFQKLNWRNYFGKMRNRWIPLRSKWPVAQHDWLSPAVEVAHAAHAGRRSRVRACGGHRAPGSHGGTAAASGSTCEGRWSLVGMHQSGVAKALDMDRGSGAHWPVGHQWYGGVATFDGGQW
jgi:hypothetical protein